MSNRDILELCWGNLLRRKTRTILSVIGVVVGVFAIVVMVSIGFGLSESFSRQIESWGNLHTVEVYNWGGGNTVDGKQSKLDDKTIKKLGDIDGVTAATPIYSTYMTFSAGHYIAQTSVVGVDTEAFAKFGYELAEGRYLDPNDKNALVFGRNVTYWFYDPRQQEGYNWSANEAVVDVLTEKIVMTADPNYGTRNEGTGDIKYEVFDAKAVGVLASENDETSYQVFMNIEDLKKIIDANRRAEGQQPSTDVSYDQAKLYVEDTDKVSEICDYIKDNYGFSTYSLTDMLKEMQKTMGIIQAVLGGIGAISLLVAAIGIANTMIMSVYERTREIGVMKVIGASLSDIRKMFLIEAGLIGFIGGAVGLLLSFGASFVMNSVLMNVFSSFMGLGEGAVVSLIPWWVAAGALAFAAFIGVISGYLPAKRAMNLSALEGLKNE